MGKLLDKLIAYLYFLLFFCVPLVVFPKTSELFEFNKMVSTYFLTVIIVSLWLIKMLFEKRLIFKKSIIDIPLIIFLGAQSISTLLSIDKRTSLLGYYSRFHGGLLSSISYSLLYWAYVSNFDRGKTLKSLKILTSSALIVSIWGILEHTGHSFSCLLFPDFGTFDTSCWVQDVKERVFATLGQPNWLAAWITALIPIPLSFILSLKLKTKNFIFWLGLSFIFFLTLLYTKSRSGILGFFVADILFWAVSALFYIRKKLSPTSFVYKFLLLHLVFLILILASGASWIPGFRQIFSKSAAQPTSTVQRKVPALEEGGTESGEIRKIVWKGALDIWKNYPIFGSGVETFAFSYYLFKPPEHNLTSEWDFLYNKAHNEYLNFAATTGTLGILSYLVLIIFSLLQISNFKSSIFEKTPETKPKTIKHLMQSEQLEISHLRIGILAGFVSILVTNFFGFSVVPVAIQFFLYPALASSLAINKDSGEKEIKKRLNYYQKAPTFLILLITSYFLFLILKYWYADYLYAKAKLNNDSGNYISGKKILDKVVALFPNEAIYWDELANSSTHIAILLSEEGNNEMAEKYKKSAIEESKVAVRLSPANVNLRRNQATNFVKLSVLDPTLLQEARRTYEEAIKLAPTDAKLFYNLSISYLRTGDYEFAIKTMEKTVSLKPNYKDARFALALMYIDKGEKELARNQLQYILENIDPDNPESKRELEELQK